MRAAAAKEPFSFEHGLLSVAMSWETGMSVHVVVDNTMYHGSYH